jgi:glutaredoxin 3
MFIIYSKQSCTYCVQAKNLLTMKGLSFIEHKVDEDLQRLEQLKNLVPNVRTVPQIFLAHTMEHIGGFTELSQRIDEFI